MEKIKFGTDGWRGIISNDFTFDNVRRVAAAIAEYYNSQISRQVKMSVGYDTRFLSATFARLVGEVLSSKGIEVTFSDKAIPTPCLSFSVKHNKLDAGVMITASHNPAEYNGVKIKNSAGGAAALDVTRSVEQRLSLETVTPFSNNHHLINEQDLVKDYIAFLRAYINLPLLKKTNFNVLVDAMHGSGNGFIADVLKGAKIKVDFIRKEVNPSFGGIRPEPVLQNLNMTISKLKTRKYDLGLVLDGDADRIAAFTGCAEFVHPQKILGLLILHFINNRKMTGGVVKTIAGTTLIDKITKRLGIKLYETPVGFKYISELMEKEDILIGGEEAGGMGFKNYIPERDGSLAGLLLLEMMAYQKKPMALLLKEIEKEFGRYYYLREDINLGHLNPHKTDDLPSKIDKFKAKNDLLGKKVVEVKDFDGVKLVCEDESWLMMRCSGTEPLVRVYSEAGTLFRSKQLLEFGKKFVS